MTKKTDEGAAADVATADRPPLNERGEFTILLAGAEMGMRPSWEAIEAIEAQLGRGLIAIAREALAATLTLGETAQVVCELVRAWGRSNDNRDLAASNPKRIGKLILDSAEGLHGAMEIVAPLLSLAVTGGFDSEGNRKPPVTTKTTGNSPAGG